MKSMLSPIFVMVGLCGCTITTGNYRPTGLQYPARPPDCDVVVFRNRAPDKPYAAISQLNVHVEKTALMPSDYTSAVVNSRGRHAFPAPMP
jgi:hypothetical protein